MDDQAINTEPVGTVELTPAGTKVQQITGVALATVAGLLKIGIIGAGVANPIFGGAAVLSAVLPALFSRKKKVAVVSGPVAASLLGSPALAASPESVAITKDTPSNPLAAAAMVLTQMIAVLTAILSVLHQLPDWSIFPAQYTPWITLSAAVVAALIPGLQKIADIFRRGGS